MRKRPEFYEGMRIAVKPILRSGLPYIKGTAKKMQLEGLWAFVKSNGKLDAYFTDSGYTTCFGREVKPVITIRQLTQEEQDNLEMRGRV